jgi:hypothetical protein
LDLLQTQKYQAPNICWKTFIFCKEIC